MDGRRRGLPRARRGEAGVRGRQGLAGAPAAAPPGKERERKGKELRNRGECESRRSLAFDCVFLLSPGPVPRARYYLALLQTGCVRGVPEHGTSAMREKNLDFYGFGPNLLKETLKTSLFSSFSTLVLDQTY